MDDLTKQDVAALIIPIIMYESLRSSVGMWTCRYCGDQTTVLSEVCSGCQREDVNQGTTWTL